MCGYAITPPPDFPPMYEGSLKSSWTGRCYSEGGGDSYAKLY